MAWRRLICWIWHQLPHNRHLQSCMPAGRCSNCLAERLGNCFRNLFMLHGKLNKLQAKKWTCWGWLWNTPDWGCLNSCWTGVFPEENPLKGWERLEAFNNDLIVQTCEALVASERLVDMRKPITCPTEWTEHPLLLLWDLELETQTRAACDCDKLLNVTKGEHLAHYAGVQGPLCPYDLIPSRQAVG